MIEKLTYTNERGETIEFSRASQYHTNFKDISGLSDIQNTVYSINSMGQSGSTYLGHRIESRSVEITGRIKERKKERIQDLRRQMNHILNPQYAATLTYEYGSLKRIIDCKIENAPVFRRDVILTQFTLQLICLNPFWREETESRQDIAIWQGGFEFPAPDGLEIPSPEGWEIGWREPSVLASVYNGGDVESGIRIDFKALGVVYNPMLLNVNTQEYIKFNLSMKAGDVLSISTGFGEKSATLTRNGVTSDAFRYLDVESAYIQLSVGDNVFRYSADGNVDNLEVSIYHNNLYLGV